MQARNAALSFVCLQIHTRGFNFYTTLVVAISDVGSSTVLTRSVEIASKLEINDTRRVTV